ncbi:MAG: MvdC/MvdD family ATP grasp protein [Patescibacteria group bacterium]
MGNNILIVTHSEDVHADKVIAVLVGKKQNIIRWNTDKYYNIALSAGQQANGKFLMGFSLDEINGVYFRRIRHPLIEADNQKFKNLIEEENTALIESILRSLENRTMINNFSAMKRVLHNKFFQLEKAQSVGLFIPETLITNDPAELIAFYEKLNGRVVCKLAKSADIVIDGQRKVMYTSKVEKKHLENARKLKTSSLIFQEAIEKHRDIRVIIVGEEIFAAEIKTPSGENDVIDYRRISKKCDYKIHHLPRSLAESIRKYMKELNLLFGAIDMILTPDGRYVFLELNVCGQWLFLEEKLNFPISNSIAELLSK